jgi:hypothetical protein
MKKAAFRVLILTNALGETTYKLQERGRLWGWNTIQDYSNCYSDDAIQDCIFASIDELNDTIKWIIRNRSTYVATTHIIETDGPVSKVKRGLENEYQPN